MEEFILALDQGTSSSRACLIDKNGAQISLSGYEFIQYYPDDAWVEHDPEEIWSSMLTAIKNCLKSSGSPVESIGSIAITNQRETVVLWDKRNSKPIYNAIVWQDRRGAELCSELKELGYEPMIQEKTGLLLDAYFSASKVKWILDNVKGARELAEEGQLLMGTIDSWLIWKLSGEHITDVSNASRTLLFNIHNLSWDKALLKLFDIPSAMLPRVVDSNDPGVSTNECILGSSIPIHAILGDQQAALFGQLCLEEGELKCTYGTGCFSMLNTGTKVVRSSNRLLSTIAWKMGDELTYALEGSVFIGGAVIQWLRDELELMKNAAESEAMARSVENNAGVVFIPALSGLGAPYWDPNARGAILGLTRATSKEHIVRAALESIAFQVSDLIRAMEEDHKADFDEMKSDGGASENDLLMQFQSDILGMDIILNKNSEATIRGVGMMAGLNTGFWTMDDLKGAKEEHKRFKPKMPTAERSRRYRIWKRAIETILRF